MSIEVIWPYLVALASAGYVLYEKLADRWKERAIVRQAHNRVFTKALKVLHSLYKRKEMLDNALGLPIQVVSDNFSLMDDLEHSAAELREAMAKDESLMPELVVSTNYLFDILNRFNLQEKIPIVDTSKLSADVQRHAIRKASMDSLGPTASELLKMILSMLVKKSSLSRKAYNRLMETYSEERAIEIRKIEEKILETYFKSASQVIERERTPNSEESQH